MSAFSDITGVSIKGGCYTNADGTPSRLEGILQNPINIIFGRNGSGKSTLARALYEYAQLKDSLSEYEVELIGRDLPDDLRKRIFVYNEAFVEKNVKTKEEGLDTIIILGDRDIQRQAEIDGLKRNLQQLRNNRDAFADKKANHEDAHHTEGYQYALKQLLDAMKADGGYADRERLIKGLNRKGSVTVAIVDGFIDEFCDNPIFPLELKQEFDDKLHRLQTLKSGTEIVWSKPSHTLPFDVNQIISLLAKQVEQPELTEREKYLLSLSQKSRHNYVQILNEDVIGTKMTTCPLCLREIDAKHHDDLVAIVQRILNKAVDEHKAELKQATNGLAECRWVLPALPTEIYDADLKVANDCIGHINSMIGQLKELVKTKYENPIVAIDCSQFEGDFQVVLQKLEQALTQLDSDKDQYNQSIRDRKKLENDLLQINRKLTWMELASKMQDYQSRKDDYDYTVTMLGRTNDQIKEDNDKLAELQADDNDAGRAVRIINKYLNTIFGYENRLNLTFDTNMNSYRLTTRGKSVVPKRVSEGERNIIGLAYFFATLNSGRELDAIYNDPMLLVIDDPISSYDYGNRVGVITFINSQIDAMLKGNKDSKVVVMSHDIQTIQRFTTMYNNLVRSNIGFNAINDGPAPVYKLDCGKTTLLKDVEKGSEYQHLLELIFEYANSNDADTVTDIAIGNEMRRVLEAYCTFVYHKGINKLLDAIPYALKGRKDSSETKISNYKSFILKSILDSESHVAGDMLDNPYDLAIPFEEKRLTAQRMLLMMYYINSDHLYCYLKKDKVDVIKSWISKEW
jgi:ABC-type multidrug transport system ATPase subunit